MGKKRKKPAKVMPPLSAADRVVYGLALAVLAAGTGLAFWAALVSGRQRAFADPQVLAYQEHASVLWAMPLIFFLGITLIGLGCGVRYGIRPLFGRRDIRYGPPKYESVYPLFGEGYVKPERQRKERKAAGIVLSLWLAGLLIFGSVFPLSLHGRDCLTRQGNVQVYNMFGTRTAEYGPNRIESATFELYQYTPGGSYRKGTGLLNLLRERRWAVSVTVETAEGETFVFSSRDFAGSPALEGLLEFKSRLDPAKLHFEGREDLNAAARSDDFTEAEQILLYQLFDEKPPA